jgi:hypothetical protein
VLPRRRRELLHELQPNATGRLDERDAATAERALDDLGAPDDGVPGELGVEVVGEQRRVQESLGRSVTVSS